MLNLLNLKRTIKYLMKKTVNDVCSAEPHLIECRQWPFTCCYISGQDGPNVKSRRSAAAVFFNQNLKLEKTCQNCVCFFPSPVTCSITQKLLPIMPAKHLQKTKLEHFSITRNIFLMTKDASLADCE